MFQIGQTVWVVVAKTKYVATVDDATVVNFSLDGANGGKVIYFDDSGLCGVADAGCVFVTKELAEAHRLKATGGK